MAFDLNDLKIGIATEKDAVAILAVQKLAFLSEAAIYDDDNIPPLMETVADVQAAMAEETIIKAVLQEKVIGAVRGRLRRPDGSCYIGRLVVHPEVQKRGIGRVLMRSIEGHFANATRYELFTGSRSVANIRLYERLGYRVFCEKRLSDKVNLVGMEKAGGLVP
jgi:ribosomal protein S18 acetylase RimI-like enzyme